MEIPCDLAEKAPLSRNNLTLLFIHLTSINLHRRWPGRQSKKENSRFLLSNLYSFCSGAAMTPAKRMFILNHFPCCSTKWRTTPIQFVKRQKKLSVTNLALKLQV